MNSDNEIVLDIGQSHIKIMTARSAMTAKGRTLFDIQTQVTNTEGFTKKGITDTVKFKQSLEIAINTGAQNLGDDIQEAHILFSAPSYTRGSKRLNIEIRDDAKDIIVEKRLIQQKIKRIENDLKKRNPRHTCVSIKPISIIADGEEIIHDYEDYTVFSTLSIEFSYILVSALFMDSLESAASSLLKIKSITPTLQLLENLANEDQKENGIIICNIGSKTTEVIVYKDGFVQKGTVLNFGGNTITAEIALAKQISMTDAEQIKITHTQHATEISKEEARKVKLCIKQFAQEKLLPLIKEVDVNKKFSYGILLIGGGSLYPHIPEQINKGTGIFTEILPKQKNVPSQFTLAHSYLIQLDTASNDRYFHQTSHMDTSLVGNIIDTIRLWFR